MAGKIEQIRSDLHMISVKSVTDNDDVPFVRELFLEYANSLNFNLCFQKFDEELKNLPGEYAHPDGRLLMAVCDGTVAGCVALRKSEHLICEMKRLYVRPAFRGWQIGKMLVSEIIQQAENIGYRKIRPDTAPIMQTAQKLYESFGFKDIPEYRFNSVPGARFMKLVL